MSDKEIIELIKRRLKIYSSDSYRNEYICDELETIIKMIEMKVKQNYTNMSEVNEYDMERISEH